MFNPGSENFNAHEFAWWIIHHSAQTQRKIGLICRHCSRVSTRQRANLDVRLGLAPVADSLAPSYVITLWISICVRLFVKEFWPHDVSCLWRFATPHSLNDIRKELMERNRQWDVLTQFGWWKLFGARILHVLYDRLPRSPQFCN